MANNTIMEISPLEWDGEALCILDQTKLPSEQIYLKARAWREVVRSIRAMQVRGAPAIGIAGAFAVALASGEIPTDSIIPFRKRLAAIGEQIACARPTAVNLQWAVNRMIAVAEECTTTGLIQQRLIFEAELILREDVAANRRIGAAGAPFIPDGGAVLTHCNAGALATGGYGTALGVIRTAWEQGKRFQVYATETRPLLQGARLTTWELVQMGIPTTLIVDSAAGSLLAAGEIGCVVVGADRIAANGDVANKIGTRNLAVLAHESGVPFYVAAPVTTLDLSLSTGKEIPIEERSAEEIVAWTQSPVVPKGVVVYNPAFDVTPNRYVSGIVTDRGVAISPYTPVLAGLVREKMLIGATGHDGD